MNIRITSSNIYIFFQCYKQAEETILRTGGPLHFSLLRVYLNYGIYFEDKREYQSAYKLFKKWHDLMVDLYGINHPTAKRAIDCLREPIYRRQAQLLGIPVPEPHVALPV